MASDGMAPDQGAEEDIRFSHIPVLAKEAIELLAIRPDGVYMDGTLGGGGHSRLILEALSPSGRLIGFDQDKEALAAATERLKIFPNFAPVWRNFSEVQDVLRELSIPYLDGILLDLGISSHQVDTAARGFSYHQDQDALLDMRMNQGAEKTAYDVVNGYSVRELARIISEYGEERYAGRIARRIAERRPIRTTGELSQAIMDAYPPQGRQKNIHPARRTFQSIRIEVNDELGHLTRILDQAASCLRPGGRICVISFHSLEDRIVKQAFQRWANPCTCPPHSPVCTCGLAPVGRILTRKPVTATPEEAERNPRARSAKLRACERI